MDHVRYPIIMKLDLTNDWPSAVLQFEYYRKLQPLQLASLVMYDCSFQDSGFKDVSSSWGDFQSSLKVTD